MNKCSELVIPWNILSSRRNTRAVGNYNDNGRTIFYNPQRKVEAFYSVVALSQVKLLLSVFKNRHSEFILVPSQLSCARILRCSLKAIVEGYDGFSFPQGDWRPVYVPRIDVPYARAQTFAYHALLRAEYGIEVSTYIDQSVSRLVSVSATGLTSR